MFRPPEKTFEPTSQDRFHFDYVEDSPAKSRKSSTRKYQEGNLAAQREVVSEEVGPFVREINLDTFIKHHLPPLKDWIDLAQVVDLLEGEGDVITKRGRKVFKKFETEPRKRKENEDVVYGPLAEIFRKVCRFATSEDGGVEENFILAMLPHSAPSSERGGLQRPDATIVPKRFEEFAEVAIAKKGETEEEKLARDARKRELAAEGKAISWYDIAMTFEEKKVEAIDQRNDNVEKCLFHLQQMEALDARRRFAFGVTIENTTMRLWFTSRGDLVVSKPFDFTTSINHLAHVFLSLAFATEEELGWDPTIQAIMEKGRRVYYIGIKDELFMTKKMLNDIAADSLLSSGSRVWLVVNVKTGNSHILKDTWIEDDRVLESAIYSMILDDVETKYGTEARNFVASHLVTPLMDWIVPVNGTEDHTVSVMTRGYIPLQGEAFELKLEKSVKRKVKQSVGPPNIGGSKHKSRDVNISPEGCAPRKHYRIVYVEVAEPIYRSEKLSYSFVVLQDSASCLNYLHGSGWVHRDLSVGNLYLYEGRGLIGDLEYARCKKSRAVAHRMRTASAHFMAAETIARSYLYKPIIPTKRECSSPHSIKNYEAPFFHNDLHDLESLWWVFVYEIFRQSGHYESDTVDQTTRETKTKEQESAATILFPDTDNYSDRLQCLRNLETFNTMFSWMPENLESIRMGLELLRGTLVSGYLEVEREYPVIQLDVLQLQNCRDIIENGFANCVNFALEIESAGNSQHSDLGGESDEPEAPAHPDSHAHASLPNSAQQRVSDDEGGDYPGSPTLHGTGKRKRDDTDLSREQFSRTSRANPKS